MAVQNRHFKNLSSVILGSVLVWAGIAGCGEDSSSKSYKGVQDVRRVIYHLDEMNVEANLISASDDQEKLTREIHYKADQTRDMVVRLIVDGGFSLQINEKAVQLKILSNGDIQNTVERQSEKAGCVLKGKSELSGNVQDVDFELDWTFSAELDGSTCDDVSQKDFQDFINAEVSNLNLNSVRDLLKASDQSIAKARNISIKMKIKGEGT